jgi:hypothetical protein
LEGKVSERGIANEMAEVTKRTSKIHEPRKLYSKAHENRRRYEPSEAVAANEKTEMRRPLTNWEYKEVKGKWDVSRKDKEVRRNIAIRNCNRRSLENALNGRSRRNMRFSEDLQGTMNKLKSLQINDHCETTNEVATDTQKRILDEVKARKQIPEIATIEQRRRAQKNDQDQLREIVTLQKLWKEFVLAVRVKQGWYEELPKRGCFCGKARISYPHWPPSSEEEAMKQFEYCMNDQNEHRRNLALRWWEHFNEFANLQVWDVSERQERYKEAADMIRINSLVVQKELERSLTHRKRPKGWSCEEYCEKVLTRKQVSCLCHCGEHRDVCPTHSY